MDYFISTDGSYDDLAKNVAYFPCLHSLLEIKVKRFTLIALTKEVSNTNNIEFDLTILIKHSKLIKEKYKM